MKVLFAVHDEKVSLSIVKKYQKEYKEIISYKNVYYFNAILKELQRDKNYDRIIVDEELEEIATSSYEQKDKFIFDKLDDITDEASNASGNDIPILLICSDRRTKSEDIFIKLFGIGIYNAIIGNDRSTDEVCRLIQKPRSKKEAKVYYQIDSDEVGYKPANNDDVSEEEMQYILSYFKKLGNNEERYIEAFKSIVSQYNEKQLKVIISILPLQVKAVLEEKSEDYNRLVGIKKKKSKNKDSAAAEEESKPKEMLLTDKKADFGRPIVVPSKMDKTVIKKLTIKKPTISKMVSKEQEEPEKVDIEDKFDDILEEETVEQVKRGRGRPRKYPVEDVTDKPKRGRGRPRKNPVFSELENDNNEENEDNNDVSMLPGFEDVDLQEEKKAMPKLPEFEDIEENENNETVLQESDDSEDIVLPGFEDVEDIRSDSSKNQDSEETDDDEQDELDLRRKFNSSRRALFEDELEDEQEEIEEPTFKKISQEDDEETAFEKISQEDDEETAFETISQEDDEETAFEKIRQEDDEEPAFEEENQEQTEESTYIEEEEQPKKSRVEPYSYKETNLPEENNEYFDYTEYNNLLSTTRKVIAFVGTSKNGTSFIVNSVAKILSNNGIDTAILDATKNKNAYFIYTKNEEELRRQAIESIDNLLGGVAKGVKVENNLTVYTEIPNKDNKIENAGIILETLIKEHSAVLIDCDFNTPLDFFDLAQEVYLVQSMDVLTIQPLTAFLRELKNRNILDENKLRIILNKVVKIKGVSSKTIVGGMSFYNDPEMSFMTELFNRNMMTPIEVPFDMTVYEKYLEQLIDCEISVEKFPKEFQTVLKNLASVIYPLLPAKSSRAKKGFKSEKNNSDNTFSNDINNTLDNMRKKY